MNLDRLSTEQRARLNAWGEVEINALKANGATEEDFKEPALANVVIEQILTKHCDELRADPEFAEALFLTLHDSASPQYFRKWAAEERYKGNLGMAYNIEILADRCERTGESPFSKG